MAVRQTTAALNELIGVSVADSNDIKRLNERKEKS